MNDIQITTPTPEDAEGIQTVIVETWLDTYPNVEAGITRDDIAHMFADAFTEASLQKRRDALANVAEQGKLFRVAKDAGPVVGVCGISGQETFNRLGLIYILPRYQGKGIGRKLWEAVLPFLDSTKDTMVQVAAYNTKTIVFYEKLGFTDTGKRLSDEKWRMKSSAVIPEMEMILKASGYTPR